MHINEQYSIRGIDYNNIALIEHGIVTKAGSKNYGKPTEMTVGYFPNVEMAYKYIVDREINGSGVEDIKTVVEKIEQLKELLLKKEGTD